MVFGFLIMFILVLMGLVLILGVAALIIRQLLKRIESDGENFEPHQEEVIISNHVMNVAAYTMIQPSKTIETGKMAHYDSSQYMNWLLGLAGVIGFITPILQEGIRGGILSGVFGIFIGILSIFIGQWFFVGYRTLLFRYIGGINLDYQEGKKIFSMVFLVNYLLTAIITVISVFWPNFLVLHWKTAVYYSVGYNPSLSLLGVLTWIWIQVIYYFLLTKRYKLTGGESILKIIFMMLATLGMILLISLVVFILIFVCIAIRH